MKTKSQIDWSEAKWRKAIVEPRKYLWSQEQIETIAHWAGFRPQTNVLDAGCGLGYLGWTYAPFFPNGKYTGIDVSENLIGDAQAMAGNWQESQEVRFMIGNVLDLPFADNTFDLVMCQTLLMHLEHPEKAIHEMVRVLKPGGTLLCFEPDNTSSELKEPFNSAMHLSIDEKILFKKGALYRIEGRRKLGRGDWGIGNKLPYLFHQEDLIQIEMKQNEQINFLVPPYDRPENQMMLNRLQESSEMNGEKRYWMKRYREEFLAGGGSQYLYRKIRQLSRAMEETRKSISHQIQQQTFYACWGPSLLYACKGVKK